MADGTSLEEIGYTWVRVRQGSGLPRGAVKAGDLQDFDAVYVARVNGSCGWVHVANRRVLDIRTPTNGSRFTKHLCGEVLTVFEGYSVRWEPMDETGALPQASIRASGQSFVGRVSQTVGSGGVEWQGGAWYFHVVGHWPQNSGDVLTVFVDRGGTEVVEPDVAGVVEGRSGTGKHAAAPGVLVQDRLKHVVAGEVRKLKAVSLFRQKERRVLESLSPECEEETREAVIRVGCKMREDLTRIAELMSVIQQTARTMLRSSEPPDESRAKLEELLETMDKMLANATRQMPFFQSHVTIEASLDRLLSRVGRCADDTLLLHTDWHDLEAGVRLCTIRLPGDTEAHVAHPSLFPTLSAVDVEQKLECEFSRTVHNIDAQMKELDRSAWLCSAFHWSRLFCSMCAQTNPNPHNSNRHLCKPESGHSTSTIPTLKPKF